MASVEFIRKRIEGTQANIAQLEKKMIRILDAQASGWEKNPYYYSERDIYTTQREIDRANDKLDKYKKDLEDAMSKESSRNVPAITQFLDEWESRTVEYFLKCYDEYENAFSKYKEERSTLIDEFNSSKDAAVRRELNRKLSENSRAFSSSWAHVTQFFHGDNSWEATMRSDIHKERDRKYDFILEKVISIVGTITDATNLSIGYKGDLNGYIIGEKGKAKVNTVSAGGYNTDVIVNVKHGQRIHFRTIITPMN